MQMSQFSGEPLLGGNHGRRTAEFYEYPNVHFDDLFRLTETLLFIRASNGSANHQALPSPSVFGKRRTRQIPPADAHHCDQVTQPTVSTAS